MANIQWRRTMWQLFAGCPGWEYIWFIETHSAVYFFCTFVSVSVDWLASKSASEMGEVQWQQKLVKRYCLVWISPDT